MKVFYSYRWFCMSDEYCDDQQYGAIECESYRQARDTSRQHRKETKHPVYIDKVKTLVLDGKM